MTHISRQLALRLQAVECRDATARFEPPLVLDRASGCRVLDVEGRSYIDLCAGFGALALGHNPPEHAAIFAGRADDSGFPPLTHGMGDVYPSRAKVDLLSDLVALLPHGLSVASLAVTGGQAVEVATKTAMLATGRSGFIAFRGGYHGLDLGVLPFTERPAFRAPFQKYCTGDRVIHLPFGCDRIEVVAAARELDRRGAGVAGVLVEPMQGRGGVRPPPLGFLEGLRSLCDRLGALLIFDEVFSGLGRSGRLTYASETPCDLLCLGKALGGGFPISACIGTKTAMDTWPESAGEALHTGTFFGHPLGCEIARATLAAIKNRDLVERARTLGQKALEHLRDRLGGHVGVRDVRGQGLMIGIEFDKAGLGAILMNELRIRGVIALASGDTGQVLSITPALTIEEPLFYEGMDIIASAVAACSKR